MTAVAIIGGSGLTNIKDLKITRREVVRTPFGEPSAPMVFGIMSGQEVVFLPRHGPQHTIPPHEINYRANLWALKESGIDKVIAIAAVGGISKDFQSPPALVIPDQIIDYTYGRPHTYFSDTGGQFQHVDFTEPYCHTLRKTLINAAGKAKLKITDGATYGATQGPRFESAAEILRMERDGADIVGMTGMPEAVLARELGLCYASIALVVNPAAGKGGSKITLEDIERYLTEGMAQVRLLLEAVMPECVE